MDVLWTSAFIDLDADTFDVGVSFWAAATDSEISPRRGDTEEFATLIPSNGDSYLRVQRTDDGSSGIHLDLHVASVEASAAEAETLGATVVDQLGYIVMQSPGGFVFCFVDHHGEAQPPVADGAVRSPDQVCIDIPPASYEAESRFWTALTGWEMRQSPLPEFRSLRQPAHIPLRFLLQRLDHGEPDQLAHAHLDIGCGDDIASVADRHVELGATSGAMTKLWKQMRDPAGLDYCLTPRSPRRAQQ